MGKLCFASGRPFSLGDKSFSFRLSPDVRTMGTEGASVDFWLTLTAQVCL